MIYVSLQLSTYLSLSLSIYIHIFHTYAVPVLFILNKADVASPKQLSDLAKTIESMHFGNCLGIHKVSFSTFRIFLLRSLFGSLSLSLSLSLSFSLSLSLLSM